MRDVRWWRSSTWAEDAKGLALTPEEGFLLSLVDKPMTTEEVVALSSFPAERVESMLTLLFDKRLIEADTPPLRASQHTIPDVEDVDDDEDEVTIEKVSSTRPDVAGAPFDALSDLVSSVPPELLAAVKAVSAPPPPPSAPPPSAPPKSNQVVASSAPMSNQVVFGNQMVAEPPAEPGQAKSEPKPKQMSVPTPAEMRANDVIARLAARARAATGSPPESDRAPVSHERTVGETGASGEGQALSAMAMLNAYTVVINEGLPDETRESAREWMRNTFLAASPEERATFLWDTEGHTLPVFAGIPFDARVTTILCAKTYSSQLLVQNLAKFTACPANLLTHLMRQNLVRRNPTLKRLVLNHPNLPNEVRKRG